MEFEDRTDECCGNCKKYVGGKCTIKLRDSREPDRAPTDWCTSHDRVEITGTTPVSEIVGLKGSDIEVPQITTRVEDHRISRQVMFMEIAKIVAKRATCYRLSVGCVLVADNRIVSIGYNGTPPGAPHCQGNNCPGKDGCHLTIHAEANAFNYLQGRTYPTDCYVTDSPCDDCAHLILDSHIQRVFFERAYRNIAPVDWLMAQGIAVYQITPSGYVIDWETKEIVEL